MARVANTHRGEVSLTLGPRRFVLRPSFSAIIAIEERLGGVIGLAVKASKGEIGLGETAVILWETVDKEDSADLAEEDLGAMILEEGLASVSPVVGDLLATILKGSRHASE